MDWNYLSSLTPKSLSSDVKDELLNTIAWYDSDVEDLDAKEAVLLLKLCQEILKYKSEQVEVLTAELDELAARQGGDGVIEADGKSWKSIKSSSLEIEDVEEKYRKIKAKLKQQTKHSDKLRNELTKVKEYANVLEQERDSLLREIQNLQDDGSHSDISVKTKHQSKELIDAVQQKNVQISGLLGDYEMVENENILLKEQLSDVDDQLSEATKHLEQLTNEVTELKINIDEKNETISSLALENDNLRGEIEEMVEEKKLDEKQLNDFALQLDAKIDEWKKILDEKNDEIKQLKSMQSVSPTSSSVVSSAELKLQIENLNKMVNERDDAIFELEANLKSATAEIENSVDLVNELISERDINRGKIEKCNNVVEEFKVKVQAHNVKMQEMQEEIICLSKTCNSKDKDIQELIGNLKGDGNITEAELLTKVQHLKSQKRMLERQAYNVSKFNNKLQNHIDKVEAENVELRGKLNIGTEEPLYVTGELTKSHQQKRLIKELQKKVVNLEDDKVNLKLQLLASKKKIVASKQFENDAPEEKETDDKMNEKEVVDRSKYVNVVEENEALRKGLHEILQSVQIKQEVGAKIESETLEQLLRALDAKHISGWYHPAMRYQAELHALQGGNSELREQLRIARLELKAFENKNIDNEKENGENVINVQIPAITSSSDFEIIAHLNKHLLKLLQEHRALEDENKTLLTNLDEHKVKFESLQQQMTSLQETYNNEKKFWNEKEEECEGKSVAVSEEVECLQRKLEEITKYLNNNDDMKLKQVMELSTNIVILNRKCIYLENENLRVTENWKTSRDEFENTKISTEDKISKLKCDNCYLEGTVKILEAKLKNCTDVCTYNTLRNNFESLTVTHRELLKKFDDIQNRNLIETKMLHECVDSFKREKEEIQQNLHETKLKLSIAEVSSYQTDDTLEVLSRKLATSEVNEITERQRADRMNNLYELVKRQLEKSEGRQKEFEQHTEDILKKNSQLQEVVKNLENKVIDSVNVFEYEEIKGNLIKTLEENQQLQRELHDLKHELEMVTTQEDVYKNKFSAHEYEILSLKHQILDLQTTTDDKALICRLSTDVVNARLAVADGKRKLEALSSELRKSTEAYDHLQVLRKQDIEGNTKFVDCLQEKVRSLQDLLSYKHHQYIGNIPLTSEIQFVNNITELFKLKHETFLNYQHSLSVESECTILKEQLQEKMKLIEQFVSLYKSGNEGNILKWYQEKCDIQLEELKHRRKLEFTESNLRQALERIETQEYSILKLEEELLCVHRKSNVVFDNDFFKQSKTDNADKNNMVEFKSKEIQTNSELKTPSNSGFNQTSFKNLQIEFTNVQNKLASKEEEVEEIKHKVLELEMKVGTYKTQLEDKQNQVAFYEQHILELRTKTGKEDENTRDPTHNVNQEEVPALKSVITGLQSAIEQKDACILKYQSLLKKDRDEHNLATNRLQEDLRKLQSELLEENLKQQLTAGTKEDLTISKSAMEYYMKQVHSLEKYVEDLHTRLSGTDCQLRASNEESSRWRDLADRRLKSMDELQIKLKEVHLSELSQYRVENEKFQHEIFNLQQMLTKSNERNNTDKSDELQKLIKEKDAKLHELSVTLRQIRNEVRRKTEVLSPTKMTELEVANEQLTKEMEVLRKRFEQLLAREKNAREEIRNLKGQVARKQTSSARSDKSDTVKEQLQKKTVALEKEVDELKENLQKQISINESHRTKVSEDFEKWNKQKHFQQMSEKLRTKLKEKTDDYDKLQQTCAGYRILIEKLEREKHLLEGKMKSVKSLGANVDALRYETLEVENAKLQSDVQLLRSKLELQHHRSGGLGTVMLQEKLENQERKLAMLELSSKSTGEIRTELERLHVSNSNLQKTNLRLEAENVELRLDLEKSKSDVPRLQEQIRHLENYVEVLKTERSDQNTEAGDKQLHLAENKKNSDLERTVYVLKRVVEKLQSENKRMQAGSRTCSHMKSVSDEQLRRDYYQLKEQYGDSVQKVTRLENDLSVATEKLKLSENKSVANIALLGELEEIRAQLARKDELLEKVKVLLHRAAEKERCLTEEISRLKST